MLDKEVRFRIFKKTVNDKKAACGVDSYSWVVQSHGLFPGRFGRVVFEVGECEKKTMIRGFDFSEETMHR